MASLFVFLFLMLIHGMPFRVFGYREQFIENMGREFPSQHRTVSNDTCVVVNKHYAVDSVHRVDPENCVDIIRFE